MQPPQQKKLGLVVTCADWRIHQSEVELNKRLKEKLDLDGINVIAVPGPDGLLKESRDFEWNAALDQIKLFIEIHKLVVITVLAHELCLGHNVSSEQHEIDIMALANKVKTDASFKGPVHAMLATYENDTSWGLKEIGCVE